MDMTGIERIAAPRERIYAALNDPEVLKKCIPGCESLEKTSDTELTATVVLKVGPVKAKFGGRVTLSDLDPPNGYTISGEGKGGAAGHAKGGAKIRLVPAGDITELHYTVNVEIGGKLAQLGGRLIDSTAKKMAGQFFSKFGDIVTKVIDAEAIKPPSPARKDSALPASWMLGACGLAAAVIAVIVLLGN